MDDLGQKINYLKDTMISVSTGGQRIQDVNDQYKKIYQEVNVELNKLGIKNPNTYSDGCISEFRYLRVNENKT